jgi:DNA mismatch repair protein MutS2
MNTQVEITASAENQLEFNKVRELLAGYARGSVGRHMCLSLHPSADLQEVQYRVDQVYEYAEISNLSTRPQLSAYEDINLALEHLAIDGYVLTQEEIHEIGRQLEQVQALFKFFLKQENRRDFPNIFNWTSACSDPALWVKLIRALLDEKGDVRPDASPELIAIVKSMESEMSRLNREFVRLISRYKADGFLTDTVESVRSGRRVLCVQVEHKRKIKGIIHDESTTGRTVFIEPELIVEINNNIIEFEGEYKKEIFRLLKELCHALRPYQQDLVAMAKLIHHWDLIQSLSLLGISYRGQRPKLQEQLTLHLIHARHPLLYLKNKARQKAVVSFDLVLHPPNRMLILSGPNAGGKSILMKAVGLIQVMGQCGMLIPADGGSVIGMSKRICVDIGDQQSIEEDLSTYSSRLKNMKETLDAADETTMILVDEFGSGTDPKIGGAIAEAILDALVSRKTYGVLTTHYPNIKMYAHQTKGVVNGAMIFDKEKIQPTYQLKIGKPGSSFAFEIAERTGLPGDVIDYARKRAGSQAMELEDLIHDLDDKNIRLQAELRQLQDKQKDLDKLVANYEQLRLDLEIKRKRFKIEQKKADLNEVSQYSQEMNRLLKDLKKEKDAEKAKAQIEKIKSRQGQVTSEIKNLIEEIADEPGAKRDFLVGDHVRLRSTQQFGVVERIEKDRAVVIIGQMKMTLPLVELVASNPPVEVQPHRSLNASLGDYSKFENELDIRGMLPEEASIYLDRFIDAAFMSSRDSVRIVHGKGTGTLRNLVGRAMKKYPFKEIKHPDKKEGGDGVTIGVL